MAKVEQRRWVSVNGHMFLVAPGDVIRLPEGVDLRYLEACPVETTESPAAPGYDPREQDEILDIFREMLAFATRDGGVKRAAGTKPSWKVDPGHEPALFSHLAKWKKRQLVDDDSGAHPLVHLAWRALAIAWQETNAPLPKRTIDGWEVPLPLKWTETSRKCP